MRLTRYTLHINFRPAASEWQTRHSWLRHANRPAWSAFVERASPRQLTLFGWPPPGHPFWTDQTLAAIQQRNPGLDVAPWRAALDGENPVKGLTTEVRNPPPPPPTG